MLACPRIQRTPFRNPQTFSQGTRNLFNLTPQMILPISCQHTKSHYPKKSTRYHSITSYAGNFLLAFQPSHSPIISLNTLISNHQSNQAMQHLFAMANCCYQLGVSHREHLSSELSNSFPTLAAYCDFRCYRNTPLSLLRFRFLRTASLRSQWH